MRIRNFAHKGLEQLYNNDRAKGAPAQAADKLRKQLAFLEAMQDVEEPRALPLWGAHRLTGDRGGIWA